MLTLDLIKFFKPLENMIIFHSRIFYDYFSPKFRIYLRKVLEVLDKNISFLKECSDETLGIF